MAIIFPANCRNVSAGALRQIKQQGYTTANGGLWDKHFVQNLSASSLGDFFRKTEPAGVFMEALANQKQQVEETSEAIRKASLQLVENARDANKQIADVSGKMRAGAENLGSAIDKLAKVAGRADFDKTVALTQSLVDSLERLAVLEEKGLLDKVMKAMQK